MNSTSDPSRPVDVLLVVRWPVGGIRTYLRYMLRQDVMRHFRVTILIASDEELSALQGDLASTGVVIRSSAGSKSRFVRDVWRAIGSGRFDLVHSHGLSSAAIAALPAWLRRVPHVVTPHDVVSESHKRGLKGRLAMAACGFAMRVATIVQPISLTVQRNLLGAFPFLARRAARMRMIRNGIDPKPFMEAQSQDIRSTLGLAPDTFVIGFFGRFMAQKGFSTLVDALEHLRSKPDLRGPMPYVLAVGSGNYRAREERELRRRGLDQYIRFMEFVPNIAGLLKSVDVVAMPSRFEACPLLPMEVMAAGVPLICSDCEAMKEVTAGAPVHVFPVDDSLRLAELLRREMYVSTREAAQSFSATAAEGFDVRHAAGALAAVYQEVGCTGIAGISEAV